MSPLMPGTLWYDPNGKRWTVGAVGMTGGERYYWLVDRHGVVAMLPALCVEHSAPASEAPHA